MRLRLPDGSSVACHGRLVIGRDPSCDVVLPSPEVSRRHAAVERRPEGLVLTDLSQNGTLVGDHLVVRSALLVEPGVPIRVGPYELHLVVGRPKGSPDSVPTSEGRAANEKKPPGWAESQAQVSSAVRRRFHRMLLDHLDLVSLDPTKMDERVMRPKVTSALQHLASQYAADLPARTDVKQFVEEMTDEALGLGPLERLLADPDVSEIMVVNPSSIFVERAGQVERTNLVFTDDEAVRSVIERIVTPLGRRIDESTPLVDARLKDGSRVNAVIRPLAIRGSCITIRKFAKIPLGMDDLVKNDTMTQRMARFLTRSVKVRKNILISGGTGSGKTTLLNVLSAAIPGAERIVTIEDAAELRLQQEHVVSLEARPANLEGKGEIAIRDLVRNALRMRPDRIIVGECRGGEALDMLQAMNTGHEGSMTTLHANNTREAVSRLETLCLMAGVELPSIAVREQIARSIHLVVQQTRLSDGRRRVTNIAEVVGLGKEGEIELRDVFTFARTGTGDGGQVLGEFRATGFLPSFLDDFITHGLVKGDDYL